MVRPKKNKKVKNTKNNKVHDDPFNLAESLEESLDVEGRGLNGIVDTIVNYMVESARYNSTSIFSSLFRELFVKSLLESYKKAIDAESTPPGAFKIEEVEYLEMIGALEAAKQDILKLLYN